MQRRKDPSSRPGDKAKKLRDELASLIQLLVDQYNSQKIAIEDGLPTPLVTSLVDIGELKSPGLLSLDFGTAMLLGNGKEGPDRLQKVAVYHTLLSAACLAGDHKLVSFILQSKCGCTADETTRSGVSPILAACFAGNAQIVELLLHFESKERSEGRKDHRSSRVDELVNVCLVGGACGRSCIEACVLGGKVASKSVLPILLKNGLRVNGIDIHTRSPLRIALQYQAFYAASLLLQYGAILTDADLDALPKDATGASPDDLSDISEILLFAKIAKQKRRTSNIVSLG